MSQPSPPLPPTVRAGQPADVPGLVRLNQHWQRSQVATTQHGFLGAAFGPAVFAALAANQQLAAAALGEAIAGYYLLNTVSTDGVLATHHQAVEELRQRQQLALADRVGVGAQACIDQAHQGTGLRQVLLQQLLVQVAVRYDYFRTYAVVTPSSAWMVVERHPNGASGSPNRAWSYKLIRNIFICKICRKNLKALRAHTRDGWQVRGESEQLYYVVLPVPQLLA